MTQVSHLNQSKPNCLMGSCTMGGDCERCGFDRKEDERRKKLPLTLCEDGLMRKIIPKRDGGEEVPHDAG